MRNYLAGLFTPHSRDCYQDMRVLPALDEFDGEKLIRDALEQKGKSTTDVSSDSRGEHDQGSVYVWKNTLQLKHEVIQQGDKWQVELKAVPGGAEIRYTTNSSDPGSLDTRKKS